VTPDRAHERDLGLGPTFAEAFFSRGVANLVCTAWRVDDDAACDFALELYAGLLGLAVVRRDGEVTFEAADKPLAMHEALLQARRRVRDEIDHATDALAGMRTWGAYQHYGDPYLRLFDPDRFGAGGEASEESSYPRSEMVRPSLVPGPSTGLPPRPDEPPRAEVRIPEGGQTMVSD
jgi:hypothetical protein